VGDPTARLIDQDVHHPSGLRAQDGSSSLDEIFSYLPPDDWGSFRACSLVARQWVSPAQRRLFSSVKITQDNYQPCKDNISPTNTELLGHVRSLWYLAAWRVPGRKLPPINGFNYLPSSRHLQHLALSAMRIKSNISEQLEVFSAFRHTHSSLSFHTSSFTRFTFVAIINYFPGVRDLRISQPIWESIIGKHPLFPDLCAGNFLSTCTRIKPSKSSPTGYLGWR